MLCSDTYTVSAVGPPLYINTDNIQLEKETGVFI